MMSRVCSLGCVVARLVCAGVVASYAVNVNAETLKASHKWPGGKGDVPDEMVKITAREVAQADVDLEVKGYSGKSLYKPTEQWGAMVEGQLDISAFPLAYTAGRHPEFDATLIPGPVKNHEHAKPLNDSPFMDETQRTINEAGAIVLAHAWLAGGFASKKHCILAPETPQGQVTLTAPAYFEPMRGRGHEGNGNQTRANQGTANQSLQQYRVPVLDDALAGAVLRSTTTNLNAKDLRTVTHGHQ